MTARIETCRESGHVRGKLGFGSQADVVAALLPGQDESHPLAIGIVYGEEDRVSRESLLRCLDDAIEGLASLSKVEKLPTAA
jgi:hypothetical protein